MGDIPIKLAQPTNGSVYKQQEEEVWLRSENWCTCLGPGGLTDGTETGLKGKWIREEKGGIVGLRHVSIERFMNI